MKLAVSPYKLWQVQNSRMEASPSSLHAFPLLELSERDL